MLSSLFVESLSLEDGKMEQTLQDMPEEELLRLDDGTPLPAELSELKKKMIGNDPQYQPVALGRLGVGG